MVDERPDLWVGHLMMTAADPPASHDFFVAAGMRSISRKDDMVFLELRGGTHLLLSRGEASPGPAPFDLMVEDLDATHRALTDRGLAVSEITRGDVHDTFTLTDPDGHEITVHNSHVFGVV